MLKYSGTYEEHIEALIKMRWHPMLIINTSLKKLRSNDNDNAKGFRKKVKANISTMFNIGGLILRYLQIWNNSKKTLTEMYLNRMALRGSNLQTAILRMGTKLESLFVICVHYSFNIFQCV